MLIMKMMVIIKEIKKIIIQIIILNLNKQKKDKGKKIQMKMIMMIFLMIILNQKKRIQNLKRIHKINQDKKEEENLIIQIKIQKVKNPKKEEEEICHR